MRRPSLAQLTLPVAALLLIGLTTVPSAEGKGSGEWGAKPDHQRAELDRATASAAKGLTTSHGHEGRSGPSATGPRNAAYVSATTTTPVVRPGIPGTSAKTLVLYDTTNSYGWLGEIYGTLAGNLTSHFGSWVAAPVTSYTAGQMSGYTAVVYIGSTYDEPIPTAFLDDVLTGSKPVVWISNNIWQLQARTTADAFVARYGFATQYFSFAKFTKVTYGPHTLTRDGERQTPVMGYSTVGAGAALATAIADDGTTVPWAVRGANLTYVGENPFVYSSETDRLRVFEDLLFDALAPSTPVRHRALLRLEDITPASDPTELTAIADYLYSKKIKFGFGVAPVYVNPTAEAGGSPSNPVVVRLADRPALVKALKYLVSKGGTLVHHGTSHQWAENLPNPYTGVSGDDYEFFRVTANPDYSLNYVGPLPGDSQASNASRIAAGKKALTDLKLNPTVFEFPHYAGSVSAYAAAKDAYTTRWERGLYFGGVLTGTTPDYSRIAGQTFPYKVRDVYGSVVLPEDLGDLSLDYFYGYPLHTVQDVLASARANLAVRDGAAGFFFHPFLDISYLKETVSGIEALGYTFAAPTSV